MLYKSCISTFQFYTVFLKFSLPLYPIIQFLCPVRKRRIKILKMVVFTVLPTLAQGYCYEIKEDTMPQIKKKQKKPHTADFHNINKDESLHKLY